MGFKFFESGIADAPGHSNHLLFRTRDSWISDCNILRRWLMYVVVIPPHSELTSTAEMVNRKTGT